MKIPKPQRDEDFDTMLDIGAALRRETKRREVAEEQEALREQGEPDDE